MKKDLVAASPRAARQEDKRTDDADFKARWIGFGMHWKKRGDAHGIGWRGQSFEQYIAAIIAAEQWATPEGVENHA